MDGRVLGSWIEGVHGRSAKCRNIEGNWLGIQELRKWSSLAGFMSG
jgi:hypothetical protein